MRNQAQRLTRPPRHGFTLVEIMIVVCIMGVLLGIALPTFLQARRRSQATSCQYNLKQIAGAKERWAMDNGMGPASIPALDDLVGPALYIRREVFCPNDGDYDPKSLEEVPECSIGGVPGELDAHILP
jgi:prepilin-type N-terminal cleavage/methylation domain-containing protein